MKIPKWTYTGQLIDLADPRPEVIDVRDVAHHLALINRHGGATFRPFTDAQHCVHVAQYAGGYDGRNYVKRTEARFGLIHDGPEYLLGDMHGPLKAASRAGIINLADFISLDERWMVAMLIRFGMAEEMTDEVEAAVKGADKVMLVTEQRDLCHSNIRAHFEYEPDRKTIEPWSWRTAETSWLDAFHELFPGVK